MSFKYEVIGEIRTILMANDDKLFQTYRDFVIKRCRSSLEQHFEKKKLTSYPFSCFKTIDCQLLNIFHLRNIKLQQQDTDAEILQKRE